MLELILLLAAGVFFLGFFIFWVFSHWGAAGALPPAHVEGLAEFLSLPGLSYQRAERLFDDQDYRFLAAQPHLKDAARQVGRDRRGIALRWLELVRDDYLHLLRFRRALLACGAPTNARTEWNLFRERLAFVAVHRVLTLWIRLFGLYATPRAHTALSASLHQLSTIMATLLGRLTPHQLGELKEIWTAHRLRPSPAE